MGRSGNRDKDCPFPSRLPVRTNLFQTAFGSPPFRIPEPKSCAVFSTRPTSPATESSGGPAARKSSYAHAGRGRWGEGRCLGCGWSALWNLLSYGPLGADLLARTTGVAPSRIYRCLPVQQPDSPLQAHIQAFAASLAPRLVDNEHHGNLCFIRVSRLTPFIWRNTAPSETSRSTSSG